MAYPTCMMHGGFGFGWIIQIIIFVAFFAIVWWLLRSNQMQKTESASEILKKRLVSGEISKKEYEELKKEIE